MPVMEIAGATVTAAAAAVAKEAFDYNRENYMFDMGLRFQRFNVGYRDPANIHHHRPGGQIPEDFRHRVVYTTCP